MSDRKVTGTIARQAGMSRSTAAEDKKETAKGLRMISSNRLSALLTIFVHCAFLQPISLNLVILRPAVVYGLGATGGLSKYPFSINCLLFVFCGPRSIQGY